MGHRSSSALIGAIGLAIALPGCGEPLLVLGDAPGFMRYVAGTPSSTITVDTMGARNSLGGPTGIVANEDGVLYILDREQRRVYALEANGRIHVLADHRAACSAGTVCLVRPQFIAIDGNTLLITDDQTSRILRLDLQSLSIDVVAGTGVAGFSADGAVAAASPIESPGGILVLPDGSIVFAERGASRIRTIGVDGLLQTMAGTGEAGSSGDGGPASAAQLFSPNGLALHDGILYVTDVGNHRVRAISLATGVIEAVAGTGAPGFGGDGGPADLALFNRPWAIALTADGRSIFVADEQNHRVRLIDLVSDRVNTFAGTGDTLYNGAGRSAGETALSFPSGVAIVAPGLLFISDTGHRLVWRTGIRFR